jgi:predicted Zn-dependent protease with MMP-like domain
MAETPKPETFEEIVDWAYRTLPSKIRDLPDFPGIQVVDEPPAEIFQELSQRKNWPRGTELRGLFSGVPRTKRLHNLLPHPELIFVFRGPILRSSQGNLRAVVKQTVWHEVAHWLGHTEEEVRGLGLSLNSEELALSAAEDDPSKTVLLRQAPDEPGDAEQQQRRCLKCYSADVICRELNKPLTNFASSLGDPVFVHAKICTCNSCGYEWDDEDNM